MTDCLKCRHPQHAGKCRGEEYWSARKKKVVRSKCDCGGDKLQRRIEAFCITCIAEGDMSPIAARMLLRILEETP